MKSDTQTSPNRKERRDQGKLNHSTYSTYEPKLDFKFESHVFTVQYHQFQVFTSLLNYLHSLHNFTVSTVH